MSHTERRPRVLVVDDYRGMHSAISRLITPSCEVVGDLFSGNDLLKATAELTPDVILLDVAMPGMNGVEACREIKSRCPQVKVIILTATNDADLRKESFAVGASGFVNKMRLATDILPAIQTALAEGEPVKQDDVA